MTVALGTVCLIGFIAIACMLQLRAAGAIDKWIIRHVQHWESPAMTLIMKTLSFIGSGAVVSVLAAIVILILLLVGMRWQEALLFFIAVSGSALLNTLLKNAFHRARPTIHTLITQAGYSFPSGHSMAAFTFYGMLTYLFWRRMPSRSGRRLLVAFSAAMIILIGLSRIYLGVHYPSDVVAAYFASGVWLALSIGLFRYLRSKRIP